MDNVQPNVQLYVVPGHYKNKYEVSEIDGGITKLDVIRVFGPDPKHEGMWLCDDGKSRTDSNILDNYELMNLAPSKEQMSEKSHLFRDFEEVVPPKQKPSQKIYTEKIPENLFKNDETINPEDINFPSVSIPILGSLEIAVIEKLNIEKYNADILDKFGDESLCKKPRNIQIILDIPFMYDLDSLRSTVKMLNLDEKTISDYLTKNMIDIVDIPSLLNNEIKNMLRDINYGNEQKTEIREYQVIHENSNNSIKPQKTNTEESSEIFLQEEVVMEINKNSETTKEAVVQKDLAPELTSGIEGIDKFLESYLG